jgi:hypothetical protein
VAAVERREFHIYPIDNVDQGIELLTGVRAGDINEPGTINFLVDQRLKQMAEMIRGQTGETRIVHEEPPASVPAKAPPEPPLPRNR